MFSQNGDLSHEFGAINCDEEYDIQEWKFMQEYSQIKMIQTIKGEGLGFGKGFLRREIAQLTEDELVL